jgi:phosphatidylglycerophosphatase A
MVITPARLREKGVGYAEQLVISGLFTGLAPIASGTVASAIAALFYFIPGFSNFYILLGASIAAFLVGIPLARRVEEATGNSDPSFVTLDEFAGMWLTLASPIASTHHLYWVVLCFFVFRVFDISKLWPASYFEKKEGGLGVMGDDMVAGAYANLASHAIWLGYQFIKPVLGFLE